MQVSYMSLLEHTVTTGIANSHCIFFPLGVTDLAFSQVGRISSIFCSSEQNSSFGFASGLSEGKITTQYFGYSSCELLLGKTVDFLFCIHN